MLHGSFINQIQRSPATRLFDDFREMLRSVAKLVGKITHFRKM